MRSSEKAKAREEAGKPAIVADYQLIEVFGHWWVSPAREKLNYHLAITLYSDSSFVKEKTEGDRKSYARGIFKDTVAFNRKSIALIYWNLPATLDDPIFDKIIDNRELLWYGANTDTIMSATIYDPLFLNGFSGLSQYYKYGEAITL